MNAAPRDEHDGSSGGVDIFVFKYRHHLELLTIAFVLTQWNYCKTCYLGNFNRKDYNFKICMKFIMHYYKIISELPREILNFFLNCPGKFEIVPMGIVL